MHAISEQILGTQRGGQSVFVASGRSSWDLDQDADHRLRPLWELIEEDAARELGAPTLYHNLANGPSWSFRFVPEPKAAAERKLLRSAGLMFESRGDGFAASRLEETLAMLKALDRTLYELARRPTPARLKALVLIENSETLLSTNEGLPPELTIQIRQTVALLAANYHAREHDLVVVFWTTREEMLPPDIRRILPVVRFPQPGYQEKLQFVHAVASSDLRQGAKLEEGLTPESVATIASGTPNAWVEQAYYRSARTGEAITSNLLIEEKRNEIERMSEGTLTLVRNARVRDVRLKGRMIDRPRAVLSIWAKRVRNGLITPATALLPGPPSSGKTDLAHLVALESGLPSFEVNSPKGSLVGETERRSDLLFRVLREAEPAIATIDEITDLLPTSRGDGANDSGASNALHAAMLNRLSDKSRMGRQLLLGMTNEPSRMSEALASRFVVLPVFGAVAEDYPEILVAIAQTIDPEFNLPATHPEVARAAGLFFEKRVLPRAMRDVITSVTTLRDAGFSPEVLSEAARSATEASSSQRRACEWADLEALRLATCAEYLPWWGCEDRFPYPPHIEAVLSKDGPPGQIDVDALEARLKALRPHVNI